MLSKASNPNRRTNFVIADSRHSCVLGYPRPRTDRRFPAGTTELKVPADVFTLRGKRLRRTWLIVQ
jgi:hypothetical protein